MNPKELLTPKRIDVVAKYMFAKNIIEEKEIEWTYQLYRDHIEAFSGGAFVEPGQADKNSFEKYVLTFKKLIYSIQQDGFKSDISRIPLADNGMITNGAHRVAAALALGRSVEVEKKSSIPDRSYDYRFFKERHLLEQQLDDLALNYIKIKPESTFIICIYPSAMSNEKGTKNCDYYLANCFNKGGIVYKKDIHISYKGLTNFMIQAYGGTGHDWTGSLENDFHGVFGKVDPCFDKCCKMRIYVIDLFEEDGLDILQIKSDLRNIFNIGNHSVHSSDNSLETIFLANILLNENSIHFLNNGSVTYDKNLIKGIWKIKSNVADVNDCEKLILDSSSALGLYGIRKTRDIDYLTLLPDDLVGDEFDNHIGQAVFHNYDVEELIANPTLHFYAWGMKCITLRVLLEFKENRLKHPMPDSTKDAEDLSLIKGKLYDNVTVRMMLKNKVIYIKRFLRNCKTRIRIWLHKHDIYIFTRIWHFLMGKGYK